MANRVTISINVRDMTRQALTRMRANLRQLNNQINRLGGSVRLSLNTNPFRRGLRAVRNALRRLPNRHTIRTVIRGPDGGWRQRLTRSLFAPMRLIGRVTGGILSDGIGQGIIAGFQKAGPVIQVAWGLVLAGLVSAIGAALSGALVLAIGGAFIAAATFIAFQADGVKKKWADTLDDLKPLFADAATGMLPVIEHARKQFETIGRDFAPHFKKAIDAAAPHVQTFMDHIIEGFRKLGARAAAPLEEAFNVFLAAFGPDMEGMLDGLGDALAALANTVRDHSTEISMALTGVFELITFLVDAINFLANAWITMLDTGSSSVGAMIGQFRILVDFIMAGCEMILGALVAAFGDLPIIGQKFKDARDSFAGFRDGVSGDLGALEENFRSYGATLDRENRERKLKVNITSWESQLRRARADLKKTSNQKAEAKLRADIRDLKNKIAAARGELNSLNGKTAHTYVVTHMEARKEGSHGTQLGFAHGGVIGAAATGGVRSNMTLVGEQGPEIVDLPTGSHVRSNSDSRRLMGGQGGGSGQPILVQMILDGRQVAEAMIDPMRGVISSKGGNVQRVLGKGGK